MELAGKIINILDEQKGESSKGPWRKQEFILETEGDYPKKVVFMAWGDKIDEFKLKVTDTVVVSINLESREYNGRWYTDVKAWKVTRNGDASANSPSPSAKETPAQPATSTAPTPPPYDDDIPF